MADEDEDKMKKMRVRIERDAYSVLLSFKDGASPSQVERRMEDTLGYTYHSKYYLAGVYDMSQILREHPQVRTTLDGKYKIIANEDNQDLVALISRQKENKKKRGGGAQRGKRPITSMGHHRNSYGGGLMLRSATRVTGSRPSSSMSRPVMQKPSTSTNRQYPNSAPRSSGFARPTGFSRPNTTNQFHFGTTPSSSFTHAQASTPTSNVQRPLVRPSTSSIATSSLSQTSSPSTIKTLPKPIPSQPTGHMPSIKEFTDNAKRMMLRLYPKSVHLSEMTDRYSQEYDVTVEPLQLFSKSWMMLVKTTFKESFQIIDGEVSLKEDWFQKYGAALKKTLVPKATVTKTASEPVVTAQVSKPMMVAPVTKSTVPTVQTQTLNVKSSLPSIQGFRYQIPKSPMEVVSNQLKALTVTSRATLPTPEKPPGLRPKPIPQATNTLMNDLFPNSKLASRNLAQPLSSQVNGNHNLVNGDPNYDARQLKNLKFVEKSEKLKDSVDAALNDNPELRKVPKKIMKTFGKTIQPPQSVAVASRSQNVPKVSCENSGAYISCMEPPQASTTPQRSRPRTIPDSAMSSRIFARALTDIHKQHDKPTTTPRVVESEQKPLYVAPKVSSPKTVLTASTSKDLFSDDGWASPQLTDKKVPASTPSTSGRKLLLPPMSKGSTQKTQVRSRPVSVCRSVSSQDGMNATMEKAMNATLPDDDQW